MTRPATRARAAQHYEHVAVQALAVRRVRRYLEARETRLAMPDCIQSFDTHALRVSDLHALLAAIEEGAGLS